MKQRRWGLVLPAVLLACFLSPFLNAKNILILYDGKKGESEAFIASSFLMNFLGHFSGHAIQQIPVSEYRPMLIKKIDVVFLFFEEIKKPVPGMLLRDLSKATCDIVWFHLHVKKLLEIRPGKYGFAWRKLIHRPDFRISYRGQEFPKEDPVLNLLDVTRPKDVHVYSSVFQPDGVSRPYILKSKNLWYVADSPFSYAEESGRYLVIADLLHDILKEPHSYVHNALVRLEDVNAWEDPENIRGTADYLRRQNVPFQISVIPIFRDPANQVEIYLHEKPEVVDAIRYAVSKDGTVVMHGVTHQYRGQSGDDFEFWDDMTQRPITHESPDWIDQRLRAGLNELFFCGIYPLAWETPHYAASQTVYHSIAKYFDTFYERMMVAETIGTEQLFPYPVRHQKVGVAVIPENLGFIDINKPDPQQILTYAKRLWVVRDGTASFFFHPFMPIKYLKTVVKGMQEMGWNFISLRDFKCNLRTESQWVTSAGGTGRVVLANQYLHELTWSKRNRSVDEKYSNKRLTEVLSKKVNVSANNLYIMEAVDLLPDKPKTGLWYKLKEGIASLFRRQPPAAPMRIFRSMILTVKTRSPEEDNDQRSFESVLHIFGFNPQKWELATRQKFSFEGYDIIVVPFAAANALMTIEANTLLDFVEKGGILITDGHTPLAEKLGIRFEKHSVPITEVQELSVPVPNLRWAAPGRMQPFFTVPAVDLAKVAGSDRPVVVAKSFGKGKVLFFGALFDPHSPFGMSRFPYFSYYLKNSLEVSFNSRRNNLEFYFDPGLRQNTSLEILVKRWKKSGVRIVYLAAWHFWKTWQFSYKYFIDLCHSQGIAVYAWFEIPQVTPVMWDEHPEWREKTAGGSDAPVGWRHMINLEHPQARQATKEFFWKVMLDYDWDGVNMAELNYESQQGMKNPAAFQPMNEQIRAEFKKLGKFDPRQIFIPGSPYYWEKNPRAKQKLLDFRVEKTKNLHIFFLNELEKIRRQKGKEIEVVVTAFDSLVHPEILEFSGINTFDIISLMDRYDFTLQVEDPSWSWTQTPDRYLKYFNVYRQYIKEPDRLMFDINVVDRGDVQDKYLPTQSFGNRNPSSFAVGTELATTLYYASAPCGRTGIYCESTVNPFDMDILPFILGSDAEIKVEKEGFSILAKTPLTLSISNPGFIPFLNNEKWPFYGNRGISIPSGVHQLQLKKSKLLDFQELQTQLNFDGDIYDLSIIGSAYSFRYNSPVPVPLSFSRSLESVRVDGTSMNVKPERNAFILPKGRHQIEIYTESPPVYAVDLFGYLSSYLFFILGTLSVGMLVVIYIYSRVKR